MAKRSRAPTASAAAVAKRTRPSGASTQPLSQRLSSTHEALATASQAAESIQTFESQFLESQSEEAIVAPTKGSVAGTVATSAANAAGDRDRDSNRDSNGDSDSNKDKDKDEQLKSYADDFEGIDWTRLRAYMKPLSTPKRSKS